MKLLDQDHIVSKWQNKELNSGNLSPCHTEVGDRWAPGLDSWCLSSGVKLKLCSHPGTPKTKLVAEAELC